MANYEYIAARMAQIERRIQCTMCGIVDPSPARPIHINANVAGSAIWRELLLLEVTGAAPWQIPRHTYRVALKSSPNLPSGGPAGILGRPIYLGTGTDRMIHSTFTRRQRRPILITLVALANGSWLDFEAPTADTPTAKLSGTIMAIRGSDLLILADSVWAMSRLTCPLVVLAKAAEQLGQYVNAPPLPEIRARKVRVAARAHGRKVNLASRPNGGLRATARLPRASVQPNNGAKA